MNLNSTKDYKTTKPLGINSISDLMTTFQGPTWYITVPLFLLFAFLPMRLVLLLCTDPETKELLFLVGCGSVSILAFFMRQTIPAYLNSSVIQFFMYWFLKIEDYIDRSKPVDAFFLSFSLCICIVHGPLLILERFGILPSTWLLFILIFFFTFYRLRSIFVLPSEPIMKEMANNGFLKKIVKEDDFRWDTVIFNMNEFSSGLFKSQISNKLPARYNLYPMNSIGRRYMSLFGSLFDINISGNKPPAPPMSTGTRVGLGAAAILSMGMGAYYLNTERINSESRFESSRAERIRAETAQMEAGTERIKAEAIKEANVADRLKAAAELIKATAEKLKAKAFWLDAQNKKRELDLQHKPVDSKLNISDLKKSLAEGSSGKAKALSTFDESWLVQFQLKFAQLIAFIL